MGGSNTPRAGLIIQNTTPLQYISLVRPRGAQFFTISPPAHGLGLMADIDIDENPILNLGGAGLGSGLNAGAEPGPSPSSNPEEGPSPSTGADLNPNGGN